MTTSVPLLTPYAGPPAVPGYAVDRFLGRGTSGVVWAATEEETGRRVALKVLEPDGPDGVVVDLLDREEALGRRLTAAHLVTVRGRVPLDDGRIAVVMRLAGGGTLRDVVTVRGALPLGEVVTALTPMATALAELHAAGMVHVDVAPGNVLFTSDGRPLLTDLSSARRQDDGWPTGTLGTPGFAAPEVADGQPPASASDVWSLGALAWYARTGGHTPPAWVGELHWAMAVGRTSSAGRDGDESGSLADVTAAVGSELTPLLVRMLADDPEVRPSAGEVALGLYRAAAPTPVGLVGHHPDPAAAVTTRIRRDAAETRSRSQLREVERAECQRHRREARRGRLRRVLVPWRGRSPATGGGSRSAGGRQRFGHTPPSGGAAPARRRTPTGSTPSADGPRSTRPAASMAQSSRTRAPARRAPSWRSRLAILFGVALVLAGGMLGLRRLTGGPLEVTTTPVSETSTPTGRSEVGGAATEPPRNAVSAWSGELGLGGARAPTEEPGGAGGSPTTAASSRSEVTNDPVRVLQRLADIRATALVAADPALLVGAEPAGSAAYESDRRLIERLRDQAQRYADLAFLVRSAEVVSADSALVVLRAVVDRSAYRVVDAAGDATALDPAPGTPLAYALSMHDGAWRLTEVRPP